MKLFDVPDNLMYVSYADCMHIFLFHGELDLHDIESTA